MNSSMTKKEILLSMFKLFEINLWVFLFHFFRNVRLQHFFISRLFCRNTWIWSCYFRICRVWPSFCWSSSWSHLLIKIFRLYPIMLIFIIKCPFIYLIQILSLILTFSYSRYFTQHFIQSLNKRSSQMRPLNLPFLFLWIILSY